MSQAQASRTESYLVRYGLLLLGLLGTALFAGIFALSFLEPLLIERAAREVVRIEVERRVGEKIDSLSGARITALAQRALQRTDVEIEGTLKAIREDMPRKVADIVARMLDADCQCRKRLVEYARNAYTVQVSSLRHVRERLTGLIESAYASVTNNLMRELRIFTASNAIAFALLAVITLVRRAATLQLFLVGLVVVGAVMVTGGLYLFNQNWLHTIVFGDYVGIAYAAYLAGVTLLFADVVFNRARLTTEIVNVALEAVGSAVRAVPC
jgi:hypothetical protein